MRVLVVHNRYRSGQPSGENAVADEEAGFLAAAGCEVSRLTVESDEIATWSRARKATLPARVVWSPGAGRLVRQAVERHAPDVVHFHNTFPLLSPAALLAARRAGAAVVATVHNFRLLCPAGTLLRDGRPCEACVGRVPVASVQHGCYRDSRIATVPLAAATAIHGVAGTWHRVADRLIFPSAFARAKHIEAGWPAHRLVVKHNGAAEVETLRNGPGHGFVCLARLEPEKGVAELLQAWSAAFPTAADHLTIIGSGSEADRLRAAATQRTDVSFTGALVHDEALAHLARARAVVVPSRWYEIFPRVVAEAYARGVPVIATRIGSLAEIVREGHTGILADSSEHLATALSSMAASDDLAVELGRGARALYEEELSPRLTADRLLEIYRDAIAERGAAARAPVAALGAR
jgi:glycosyltransferase involved in cell wall biosynthesis